MIRQLYVIEVQKPTMTTKFLKVFDDFLVIDGEKINADNTKKIKLFNDRIELYTYIKSISGETQKDFQNTYYSLVKAWGLSLEYSYNNWVFIIPKDKHEAPTPLYHVPIELPRIKEEKPIKFYPEKTKEEEEGGGSSDPDDTTIQYKNLFSAAYYSYFWECYCRGNHSIPYNMLEAFILTFGYYLGKEIYTKRTYPEKVYRYKLIETQQNFYDEKRMCDFTLLTKLYVPTYESYYFYIEPSLEGKTMLPNREFYSTLLPREISHYYWNFVNSAIKWYKQNI